MEMKSLYNKNYKSWKKEVKKTLEDGRISHAHGSAETIL
jgi:hypothetical protein